MIKRIFIKKVLPTLFIVQAVMLSFVHSTAATQSTTSDNPSKITSTLYQHMTKTGINDKIPVYIWYDDISQKNVDVLTERNVGFSIDECDLIGRNKFVSSSRFSGITFSNLSEMNEYINYTDEIREIENTRVDQYILERRKIAQEKYFEKYNRVKKDLSLKDENVSFHSDYAPMIIAQLTQEEINSISSYDFIEFIDYYENRQLILEDVNSAKKLPG